MANLVDLAIQASVRLSPMEEFVINFLTDGEETTTKDIATAYYSPNEIPLNGQIVITKTARKLQKKTARDSPYVLEIGGRHGPYPMTVRLVPTSTAA
jgi:hypothetical protein